MLLSLAWAARGERVVHAVPILTVGCRRIIAFALVAACNSKHLDMVNGQVDSQNLGRQRAT